MIHTLPRVVCITNDNYLWAVRPYAYLMKQYWDVSDLRVVVAGFTPPDFELPPNFQFHSIDKVNYPKEKWSNGFIKLLQDLPNDDLIVLMLEDYWLIRQVDGGFMHHCAAFMRENPNILRIDLTNDRLHALGDARAAIDFWNIFHYDIIITPFDIQYRMSFQAGMWNRKLLLDVLKPDKSPWETEIHTNPPDTMLVLGTRQWPMRYCNAIYKGKLDEKELSAIPSRHMKAIQDWIPKDIELRETK